MTSSLPSQKSDQGGRTDSAGGRQYLNNPVMLKEELRQSIIAKRHARGEKQLKIEHREPQEMALTPAEVEKKERRREQNRRAAQRCRHKKRLNQTHVIQNYEQVVARNEELEKELDAVKHELNKLRNTFSQHDTCCSSFGKVKPAANQGIKMEPMSVDDNERKVATEISMCSDQYSRKKVNDVDMSPFVANHHNQADRRATSTGLLGCAGSTSCIIQQQPQVGLAPQETDFLHPPQSHSMDPSQGLQWGYTRGRDENNSPSSRMLIGLNPGLAALLVSAQLQANSQKYLQKPDYEQQPQQEISIENIDNISNVLRPHLVHSSTIPSVHHANTQRYTLGNGSGHVLSQNSPCHIVPSMRSPRPDSVTSTVSFTYDTVRHRSLSGGSGCVSDAPHRCRTEGEFSSVSSEGSWSALSTYQDWRTLEVPDTDTDDVFMAPTAEAGVPLDGHDDNNNLEAFPDHNLVNDTELLQLLQTRPSVIDWLSSTPESTNSPRDDALAASDSANPIIDSEEVIPLLQFSTEDLQLFDDIENGEQTHDYLSTILQSTQRINY